MENLSNNSTKLKTMLNLTTLLSIAIGVVVGQGAIVSVLQGVGLGGTNFILVLLLGLIIALCNVDTFSELSLMFPKSGGLSTYTEAAMGHFPAMVATFSGYVVVAMFGLSAEVLLVGAILEQLFPTIVSPMVIAFGGIAIFTTLNIMGTDVFSSIQNFLTYFMLVVLSVVSIVALSKTGAQIPVEHVPFSGWGSIDGNFIGLMALGLWAYMGLEFVCPMIEESKNPNKNIPRSMFIGAIIVFVLYTMFALGTGMYLDREVLASSPTPHIDYAVAVFGESAKWIIAIIVLTASGSTINTVIASVSRMIYGMAENGQAFSIFKKVHPKTKTPWVAILFMGGAISLPLIFIGNDPDAIIILLISAAAAWLLAYMIAHMDLLILRRITPDLKRPYKSYFYPIPQLIGIAAMVYLILNNSPTPEMTATVYQMTGVVLGIVSIMSIIWVKFVMKKGLFERENSLIGITSKVKASTYAIGLT